MMITKKPQLDIKPTPSDKKLVRMGWIIVALNYLLILVFYFDLPDTIPTHFNLQGEADDFGHKSTLWIIPVLSTALYFGMGFFVTHMKPSNINYPIKVTEKNAPRLYALGLRMLVIINLVTVVAFLLTTFAIVFKVKGILDTLDVPMLIGIWVVAGLVPFYFLYKMYTVSRQ